MRYVIKYGNDFVFEAENPNGFLKLLPNGDKIDGEADRLSVRKQWASSLENWNGKKHRYHSDAALVHDMFKSGSLDIVVHQPNWRLKKLNASFCYEGLYHFEIDCDQICRNGRWYGLWTNAQNKKRQKENSRVRSASIYQAFTLMFGIQNLCAYMSELERDLLCSEVRGFCRENDFELPFTWKHFKHAERWAKEVLYFLHKNQLVKPVC